MQNLKKQKILTKDILKSLSFLPFCIDTEFWTDKNNKDITKNKNIIFVGNDGNRDFELLDKISRKFKTI